MQIEGLRVEGKNLLLSGKFLNVKSASYLLASESSSYLTGVEVKNIKERELIVSAVNSVSKDNEVIDTIKLDGNNVTLLYGYGGFNINLEATFNATLLPFLKAIVPKTAAVKTFDSIVVVIFISPFKLFGHQRCFV